MRCRRAMIAQFALLSAAASLAPAGAQAAQAPPANSTRTIGELLDTLVAGAALVHFADSEPVLNARLDSLADCFATGGTQSLTVEQAASLFDPAPHQDLSRGPTNVTTIARWYRSPCEATSRAELYSAVVSVNKIANGTLRGMLGVSTRDWVDSFISDMDAIVVRTGMNANQTLLTREAAKYGPGAPQLNVAEVLVNYLVQLVPLIRRPFLPDPVSGPSSNEIVLAYRTTDLTAAQSAAGHITGRVVSSGQVGLRRYTFTPKCGQGPPYVRVLRPCTWSTGLYVMSPGDVPMSSVWGKGTRFGWYLALSDYHLGCTVFVGERRCAVGLTSQVLPYLF